MFSTVEVRWFLKGVIPLEAWEWFTEQECNLEKQPSRTDYYYIKINCGDLLGIKLREG